MSKKRPGGRNSPAGQQKQPAGGARSAAQDRSAARRGSGRTPTKRPIGPAVLGIGGVVLVAGLVIMLIYRAVVSTVATGSGATMSDHWHAPFKVVVCGARVGPLPAAEGDIHSHGDDVIHIHPHTPASQGRNANLAAFLKTVPLKVTSTSLEVNGKTYNNGDKCPDGTPGTVTVLVNDKPVADFLTYTPRDRDQVEFRFGP
jgi:hypothetical protein